MAQTQVWFYQGTDGSVPVRDWLDDLIRRDRRAYQKCLAAITRLEMLGHELRRPMADHLRDGIYELRIRVGHMQYRLLYFFHGRDAAVLAGALVKEQKVPPTDINRALDRKRQFEANPLAHRARS